MTGEKRRKYTYIKSMFLLGNRRIRNTRVRNTSVRVGIVIEVKEHNLCLNHLLILFLRLSMFES